MRENNDFTYPRETVEYVYFEKIKAHGQEVNAAEFTLTAGLARPTSGWSSLVKNRGLWAFLLAPILPGKYRVWVRIPEQPEASVTEVGMIEVT